MAYPSLKTHWNEDSLAEHFAVQRGERRLIEQSLEGVRKEANRLGFAVLLKTYQFLGRPPRGRAEVPGVVVEWIARQVRVDPSLLVDYSWKNTVWKRHLQLIRKATNHRAMRLRDFADLEGWLIKQGDAAFASRKKLFAMAVSRCHVLRLELPAETEMRRRLAGVWRSYLESAKIRGEATALT